MAEFTMEPCAYCKMVLHALKYPYAAVLGLLLGEKRGANSYTIRETVPLVHDSAALGPPLEAGLAQADAWATSKGWHLMGVYHANEGLQDLTRPGAVMRLAEKVQVHFAPALLLTINNTLLGAGRAEPCYDVFSLRPDSKGWEPMPRSKVALMEEEATLRLCAECVSAKMYRDLADFDNHLDNLSADFTNGALSASIASML